ncbi:MAG: hypothetical protein KIT84_01255 [Labilithrix sp.]|nr:hypothetical protein [Labilithrix sp.]MCW5809613.1 hypothetical protein [Labilithrix sp.]
MSAWRDEDEMLLQRLEDETVAERLFALLVADRGDPSVRIHPRAGGLVGEVRKLPGGAAAVTAALAGDVAGLGHFIDKVPLARCTPELLHHLALFHAKAASALESTAPDLAANAWVWSLASWLALGEERAYLSRLEEAVLGPSAAKTAGIPPERVGHELVGELGRRADAASRDLKPAGTSALLALARSDDAAKIASLPDAARQRLKVETNRRRNAAIEGALDVIREALDEANVQGELTTKGRTLVLRAVAVWTWSGHDEQVEHFVVGQLERIGWELYRERNWSALRYLLDPFKPMMETLARRVEKDPSQLAYAAGCAQMFVFMSETDMDPRTKLAAAERAMKICPTHRNGRVVLASMLCDNALDLLREMTIVKRAADVERAEAMIKRAEVLYPATRELDAAKKKLEEVKTKVLVSW